MRTMMRRGWGEVVAGGRGILLVTGVFALMVVLVGGGHLVGAMGGWRR